MLVYRQKENTKNIKFFLDWMPRIQLLVICPFLYKIKDREPVKVITKLPNSEQSYKGKVQTHNYTLSKGSLWGEIYVHTLKY
jgi:hypothetical protein